MNLSAELQKLTRLCEDSVKGNSKSRSRADAEFIYGNVNTVLSELFEKIAPFGRGAVFFAQKESERFAREIPREQSTGVKIINVVCENESCYDSETADEYLNLPEDVRFAVASDLSALNVAKYFSQKRDVPLIFVPSSLKIFFSLYGKSVFNRNGSEIRIPFDRKIYVVADDTFVSAEDADELFAHIMGSYCDVIDYRVNCAVNGIMPDHGSFNLFKNSVLQALKICDSTSAFRKKALFICGFSIELASKLSGDKIYESSAPKTAVRLFGPKSYDPFRAFDCAVKTLAVYDEGFKAGPINRFPDYLYRRDAVCYLTGEDHARVSEWLTAQLSICVEREREISALRNNLKGEVSFFNENLTRIINCYRSLSGERRFSTDFHTILSVLLSGDCREINGMSLMREWGVTEDAFSLVASCDEKLKSFNRNRESEDIKR